MEGTFVYAAPIPSAPSDQPSAPWPQPGEVKFVVPDMSAIEDLREIEADLEALLERVRRAIKRRGG